MPTTGVGALLIQNGKLVGVAAQVCYYQMAEAQRRAAECQEISNRQV